MFYGISQKVGRSFQKKPLLRLRAGAELANGCSISITVLSRLDQQRLYSGEAWRYCTTDIQPPLTLLEKAYTS